MSKMEMALKLVPLFDNDARAERVPHAAAFAPDDLTDASESWRTPDILFTTEV
jgi:hypothetical protein